MNHFDHLADVEKIARRVLDGRAQPGDTTFIAAWAVAIVAEQRRQPAAPDQPELFFSLGGGR